MDNKLWKSADSGKLRTCAYMPIGQAQYDDNGHIIPFRTDSGFEEPFVPAILYDGVMATEDIATYKIPMPEDPLEAKTVSDRILAIAKKRMQNDD